MANVLDLITTNGTPDATKMAAWIGCVGVLFSGVQKATTLLLKCRNRVRIAEPEYSYAVSVSRPQPHIVVSIENVGRSPIDIEQVRLEWRSGAGARASYELAPTRSGPVMPKRGIDHDWETDAAWKCEFLMPRPDSEIESLKMILDDDQSTLSLQVWAVGRDRPLWEGSGERLKSLRAMMRAAIEHDKAIQSGKVR
jgi:hypothetical protein